MGQTHHLDFFRSSIKDLARPYFWRATFTGKAFDDITGDSAELVQATLRTSSIPGINLNEVAVNYFGMMFKMAGTPTYEPMQAQFIIDEGYKSHKIWHDVLDKIFKYDPKLGPCWTDPEEYMGTVEIVPLACTTANSPEGGPNDVPDVQSKFILHMAYLSSIGSVQFNHDTKDSPLTFDATITYSYFTRGSF